MRYHKYLSIALAGIISATTLGSVSANSLHSVQQSDVNDSSYQIDAYNKARLEEIRLRNQQKRMKQAPRELRLEDIVVHTGTPKVVANTTKNVSETPSQSRFVGNVDMNRVEKTWQGWVNGLRKEKGLHPYQRNAKLSATAQEWSDFSKNRGYIIHGRPGDGCVGEKNYGCYNFRAIDKWFSDRGVNPVIKNRSKHTENLGIGTFRCSASDCTDAAIKAIRQTYNFFYNEKSYNGVHYRSMVNPHFTEMGVGLAFRSVKNYLTIHYSNTLK